MTKPQITDFHADIAKGKVGEVIFVEDFLQFQGIPYEDVTGNQGFRVMDVDMRCAIGLYEVKANYRDDRHIYVEEYTNINPQLGPVRYGWFYTSTTDTFVFVSKTTRSMVLVPFTPAFKTRYEEIKEPYSLVWNRISVGNDRNWQSAYRRIPLESISGLFAFYKVMHMEASQPVVTEKPAPVFDLQPSLFGSR